MRKQWWYFVCSLIISFGFLSKGWSRSGQPLPPIDSPFLIAGLQHAESLLVSGKGEVNFQMEPYQQRNSEIFAFHQKKAFVHYQSGFLKGQRLLFNGEIQLALSPLPEDTGKVGGILLVYQKTINLQEDPRNWGIQFLDTPLSQYLQEHGVRFLGSEVLEKVPCYVVESVYRDGSPMKFWIAPEGGFRCVQIQHQETWYGRDRKPVPSLVTMRIYYKAYQIDGQTVWFPLKGVREQHASSDGRFLDKVVMEVKDFHVNVDISDLFQIKVDPEFPVWVERLGKPIPFKEIGWKP